MATVFRARDNLAMTLVILVFATVGIVLIAWWIFWPRGDYARHVDWTVAQPVPFSHEHHVAGLGIDCRFCHAAVEVSSSAGMPTTYTCMTCHSQIWTNAKILEPVRRGLADNQPLIWNRVNDLPDYVYFNHAIHIAKGVGCASCHGEVDRMSLSAKARSFTMQFCLECHHNPAPNLRPAEQIFNMHWRRTDETPPPEKLMADYHIGDRNLTDCSICHR